MYRFFEFFAGGGMARMGLGEVWSCAFANDCSEKKTEVYRANFPDAPETLRVDDVANIRVRDLPGTPDLVWGSFSCQDLSLAGSGAGLFELRKHPDVRIARRASTIASLAKVISERDVSPGLRRTLVTQARRLGHLARQRFDDFAGEPIEIDHGQE